MLSRIGVGGCCVTHSSIRGLAPQAGGFRRHPSKVTGSWPSVLIGCLPRGQRVSYQFTCFPYHTPIRDRLPDPFHKILANHITSKVLRKTFVDFVFFVPFVFNYQPRTVRYSQRRDAEARRTQRYLFACGAQHGGNGEEETRRVVKFPSWTCVDSMDLHGRGVLSFWPHIAFTQVQVVQAVHSSPQAKS
jgi:hypothetical protein